MGASTSGTSTGGISRMKVHVAFCTWLCLISIFAFSVTAQFDAGANAFVSELLNLKHPNNVQNKNQQPPPCRVSMGALWNNIIMAQRIKDRVLHADTEMVPSRTSVLAEDIQALSKALTRQYMLMVSVHKQMVSLVSVDKPKQVSMKQLRTVSNQCSKLKTKLKSLKRSAMAQLQTLKTKMMHALAAKKTKTSVQEADAWVNKVLSKAGPTIKNTQKGKVRHVLAAKKMKTSVQEQEADAWVNKVLSKAKLAVKTTKKVAKREGRILKTAQNEETSHKTMKLESQFLDSDDSQHEIAAGFWIKNLLHEAKAGGNKQ